MSPAKAACGASRDYPNLRVVRVENAAFMQRVRIGLTGLAFVFVVVMLAAVFTRPSEEEPITANTIDRQFGSQANLPANEAQPKEPLAELGVVPGNAEGNGSAAPGPASAPPARR